MNRHTFATKDTALRAVSGDSPRPWPERPRPGGRGRQVRVLDSRGVSTARLETFADGVFAIAATLLILNVDAQVSGDLPDLGARLAHIWPSYLAYAVSFVTI